MKLEDKVEMVCLLNSQHYEEAAAFFNKEEDWDDQAVIMFVNGFDLAKYELLEPIKERITAVQTNDFRTAMRLGMIQVLLNS